MARPVLKSTPYANWRVLSPAGVEMFQCGDRKRRWYLSRGLAEAVEGRPDAIRLTFEPGGPGHAGDAYYLTPKDNLCVVCGATGGLTRHHVVPFGYRQHFPDRAKKHNYHDVVLLCAGCHDRYEVCAVDLKKVIAAESGVSIHGTADRVVPELVRVRKAACAILRYGRRIPAEKLALMRKVVADHLGREPDERDLLRAAATDYLNPDYRSHGAEVAARFASAAELDAFVQRWRDHFLATMRPAHMPANWDRERPAHEHWHVDNTGRRKKGHRGNSGEGRPCD